MEHKFRVAVKLHKREWLEDVVAGDSGEAASSVLNALRLEEEQLALVSVIQLGQEEEPNHDTAK